LSRILAVGMKNCRWVKIIVIFLLTGRTQPNSVLAIYTPMLYHSLRVNPSRLSVKFIEYRFWLGGFENLGENHYIPF
jgi:hypothetical protein